MTRGRSLTMALAVLVLAPLPLAAQGGGPGGMRGMMGARLLLQQSSVEFLAGKGTELTLDAAQSARLRELAAKWTADTKETRERIRAEMPEPGQAAADREAMRVRMRALQPHFEKLVEEDEKALAEAMKALTEAQQARAAQLLEERRATARPRRPGDGV